MALVLTALMQCAWRQTSYWSDSETLWTHTLACTSQNSVAHNNLGVVLAERGRIDKAIDQYQSALNVNPDYAEAHTNLGNALKSEGKLDEAIASYRRAVELEPRFAGRTPTWAMR